MILLQINFFQCYFYMLISGRKCVYKSINQLVTFISIDQNSTYDLVLTNFVWP